MAERRGMQLFGVPASIFFVMFVPGHLFSWAVEWMWLVLQLLSSIILLLIVKRSVSSTAGIKPEVWTGFFLLVTAFGAASALHAAVVLNIKTSVSDIPDLLRFLIFIPLALFIGTAATSSFAAQLERALKLVVIFNLVTAGLILLNVPVFSGLLMVIYGDAKIQFDYGHIRIGIPFTNPNFAALVFVLALGYFSFFRKSLLFSVLTIVSLFLTGSRSGLLAAAPILMAVYALYLARAVRRPKLLLLLLVLHAAAIAWVAQALEAMGGFGRIVELIEAVQAGNLAQVDTASIRFDLVRDALRFIERSPLVGIGPGRSYGLDVTDSQLIAWPVMYGIPLALLIGGFFLWMFISSVSLASSGELVLGLFATAASFFLMLSTGDFMKNYRLFYISVLIAHGIYLVVASQQHKRNRFSGKVEPLAMQC